MKYVLLIFLSTNAYAFAVNHPAPTPKSSFTVEPVVTPVQQIQEPAIVPDPQPAPAEEVAPVPSPAPEPVKPLPPRLKPAKVRLTEVAKLTPTPFVAPAPKVYPPLEPQFLLKVIVVMKDGEHCQYPTVDIETQKWSCLDGILKK
jgi:hypothetical protein